MAVVVVGDVAVDEAVIVVLLVVLLLTAALRPPLLFHSTHEVDVVGSHPGVDVEALGLLALVEERSIGAPILLCNNAFDH